MKQEKAALPKLPKRPSNVDLVIDRIKELLLEGELKPGQRLPNEMELAGTLGVSRGSIREAMKILSAFGIVNIKQGDGTYVATSMDKTIVDPLLFSLILSRGDKQNILELRELFETGLVYYIIKNCEEEDLARLEASFLTMKELIGSGNHDVATLVQHDIEFHMAMGLASRNPLLAHIYSFIMDFLRPTIEKTLKREETPGTTALTAHKGILEGLRARNLEQSIEAIKTSQSHWMRLYGGE